MRVLGGGASGINCNPNNDGTETILLVLAVGDEASCIDS